MAQASEIKKQYKKRTLFQETWRRLTKNRGAMLGLAFLVLLVLAAALSPVIFNYEKDVIGQNMKDRLMGPCAAHWFGTDEYGRDLFARIVYGARYSLIIGVGSVLLGLLVGTILGSQAGFKGGITDSIIMRGIDIFYSIPNIMTAVVIVSLLGPSTVNLMIALAFSCASSFARIVRASVMTIRDQEYVESSYAMVPSSERTPHIPVLKNGTTEKTPYNFLFSQRRSFEYILQYFEIPYGSVWYICC